MGFSRRHLHRDLFVGDPEILHELIRMSEHVLTVGMVVDHNDS
jgi:hypothetical protein